MINKFGKFTRQNAEAGNTTVIALVISAAALAGISQMLDSSVLTRKNIAAQDVNNQEKDTPRSAAVIAKSLISRPASVESNLAAFWVSDGIRDHKDRLPYIYPSPYVAGLSGAAAARPTGTAIFKSSVTTGYAGLPFDASTVNSDSIVKVLSLDSGRSTNSNFETVLTNPNYAVSNADFPTVVQRTQSRVTYQLIDCEKEGQKSTTFTGYYCVFAAIESDTYTKDSSGTFTKSTKVNKGGVSLGLLPVPPAPVCSSVTTNLDSSGKIAAGGSMQITVKASGVAVGYRVAVLANGLEIGSVDSGTGMKAYNWNTLGAADASETILFDTTPIQSKMSASTTLTTAASLTGVDGTVVNCPNEVSLKINNPNANPNDKPTCELRPVQADKFYTACTREAQASGLMVKITSPTIPIDGNPVVTKYHDLTSGFPTLSWRPIDKSNLSKGYPCTDGPCLWGPAYDEDVLLPGLYEVKITSASGKSNTCSAYVYGAYDTGYRCNASYSEQKIGDSLRKVGTDLGMTIPAGPKTVAAEVATHQKLCSMVGMKVGYADVYGSEMRPGYSSCGDNSHLLWNNAQGKFIVTNACNYYWTGGLICN